MLHFLIAVDGSEHAAAAVRWIAGIGAAGVRLRCTLLNVQKPIMVGEVGAVAPAGIALEQRERSAAEALEHAAGLLRPGGLPFESEERLDDPRVAIVARAQALGCDAIVVGRRGLGSLRAALLGSVSTEVVRRAGMPVVVVNAGASGPPAHPLRSLAAVDGSESALRATAFAARLAAASSQEVHLLRVEPTLTVATSVFGPREQVVTHWSGKHAQEAMAGARDLLDRARVQHAEHVVSSDDAGSAILQAADASRCGIVAMGTRGLGPVAGLVLGSVARSVLERAPGTVAAVALVR